VSISKVPKQPDSDRPLRAALYVRVSTARQAEEGLSLDEQLRSCREAIERRPDLEGSPDLEYVERGVSGRKGSRPELDRLLRDAEEGRFSALVIMRLNRFGRSVSQLSANFDRLDAASVELVSLRESIDTSTSAGRLLRNVLASIAEFENDARGDSIRDVAEPRARSGRAWGGRFPPFGYRRQDKRLVIDPREAEVVRRIYAEAADGHSQYEITKGLNADGVKTSNGKAWTQASIGRLLRRPVYYGAVTYKGEVVCEDGDHEAIISREKWDEVARLRAERDKAPGSNRGRNPRAGHLLTRGILKCRCGYSLSPRTYRSGKGKAVYECRGRKDNGPEFCPQEPIAQADIDVSVLEFFKSVALDVEATRSAWTEGMKRRVAEARGATESAERAEGEAAEAFRRIRRDYKAGKLSAEDWTGFRDELAEEHKAAAAEVERLREREREIESASKLENAEEEVLRWLSGLQEAVAGPVKDATSIGAIRRALLRVFDRFELAVAGETLIAPHQGHDPGIYLAQLINGEVLEIRTVVRAGLVEKFTAEGAPLILKRVPMDRPTLAEQMRHTG